MTTATTRSFKLNSFIAALAGTVLVGSMATQSVVAAPGDVPAVVVSYDPVTLTSTAGTQQLYRRIDAAAQRICDMDGNRELARRVRAEQCRRDAVTRAVRDINDPRLAKLLADSMHQG
jgi:UrcA family protein